MNDHLISLIDLINTSDDWEVEINGYEIIQSDMNRMRGGVGICITKNITYDSWIDLIFPTLEAICIEIRKPKSKPLLISTSYRPLGSNTGRFDLVENFLRIPESDNKEIVNGLPQLQSSCQAN